MQKKRIGKRKWKDTGEEIVIKRGSEGNKKRE